MIQFYWGNKITIKIKKKYYPALNKQETLPRVTKWTQLEDILLTGVDLEDMSLG